MVRFRFGAFWCAALQCLQCPHLRVPQEAEAKASRKRQKPDADVQQLTGELAQLQKEKVAQSLAPQVEAAVRLEADAIGKAGTIADASRAEGAQLDGGGTSGDGRPGSAADGSAEAAESHIHVRCFRARLPAIVFERQILEIPNRR